MAKRPAKVNELEFHLRRFGRRLRLRDGWLLAQRTIWIAALAGVLIQVTGRIFPIEKLSRWTLLPFLIWLIFVVFYPLFKPQSLMQIARLVDLELSLKERLSTALVLQSGSSPFSEQSMAFQQVDSSDIARTQPSSRISFSTPNLTHLQRNDALSSAAKIIPGEAFALNYLVRPLATGAVLISIILALSIIPNPQTLVLKQRSELQQAAKEQARQIEIARQEIEASKEISPEMREELLRQLAELAKNLQRNSGDLEQALADLSKLEQELKRKLDPNLASRQALLESLASQLAQATGDRKSQDATQASEQALDQLAEADRPDGRNAAPGTRPESGPGSRTSRAIWRWTIEPGARFTRSGCPIRRRPIGPESQPGRQNCIGGFEIPNGRPDRYNACPGAGKRF